MRQHFFLLCISLLSIAVAAPAALPAQTPTFSSIRQIPTRTLFFAGNFNGNGNTDLIVAGSGSPFSFLTGDGTGNFSSPISMTLPTAAALVADVNGDGKDDLISLLPGCEEGPCGINPNEGDLDGIFTVWLSQGNGKFTKGYVGTLPPGDDGVNGVVGDFNKDGKPDIAVLASPGGNSFFSANPLLCIFINQGNGTFIQTDYAAPDTLSGGQPELTNLVVGDFEGNGNQDVAFAFDSLSGFQVPYPEVLTFAGNGKGGFGPGVVSYTFDSALSNPYQPDLYAADLNRDGRTDLLLGLDPKTGGVNERVPSLLANTSGRFYWSSAVYMAGRPAIVLSDLNGDGKPDLLFLNNASTTTTVQAGFYLGLGTGAFQTPHTPITFTGNTSYTGHIAAIPLKNGALPSLFVWYDGGISYLELRINTTK